MISNQRIKLTISEILGRAINWSFMFSAALFLNVQEYGYFSLIIGLEVLLSIAMLGGMDRGAMRFLSDKAEDVNRKTVYLGWLLFSLFPMVIIFGIGSFTDIFIRYKVTVELIPIFILGLFLVAQSRLFCTISRAESHSGYFFTHRVVTIVLKILLFIFLIYSGISVVETYLFSIVFSSLVSVVMVRHTVFSKAIARLPIRTNLGDLYRYSLPFLPHMLAGNLVAFSDRFILEYYVDASSVGVYSFAYMLGSSISLIYAVVALIYEKELFSASSTFQRVVTLQEAYYRFLNQVAFCFFLFLAAGLYWIPEYTELARDEFFLKITTLVFFSSVFHTVYLKASYYLSVDKKSMYIALSTLISLVINVSLNIFLIPRFGMVGAVYATVLSYILLSLIVTVVVRIKTKYRVITKVTFFYMMLSLVCMGLSYMNIYYSIFLALTVVLVEIKKTAKNAMYFFLGKGEQCNENI